MHESVGDIMTKVVTCASSDYRLAELEKVMEDNDIRCLPIINKDGRCIGIVTPMDILHWHRLRQDERGAQAEDILTQPAISVEPQLSATAAIELMISKNLHHLIVETKGELVGILSVMDFLEKLYLKGKVTGV